MSEELSEIYAANSARSKFNNKRSDIAANILAAIASKITSGDDKSIQDQVNTAIKYANTFCETIEKVEKEEFAKARKRIK